MVHGRDTAIAVALLETGDADLVERLTALVNDVYATSEEGLWQEGSTRTTAAQMAERIAAREVAVATLDGEIAGAIHVHAVSNDTGEFGTLAADPEHRGHGVGRALVAFAEQHCRERGLGTMQLELLVPRDWRHPSKVFLDAWYRRLGYRVAARPRSRTPSPSSRRCSRRRATSSCTRRRCSPTRPPPPAH